MRDHATVIHYEGKVLVSLDRIRRSSIARRLRARLISAVRRAVINTRGQSDAPPDIPDRLVAGGIVDREFYETLCGRAFDSDLEAARHLIREGIGRGLTCNPLLEPGAFPPWLQEHWAEGRAFRVITASKRANVVRTSPLFHVPTWAGVHPESADHPGGPLGHFIEHAAADTTMPCGPEFVGSPPTWAQAREALLYRASEYQRHSALLGVRYKAEWDEARYADWLREWSDAPLPDFADRPAVSVVIPVKNRPEQVAEAIHSVQLQTFQDWELLVVDDGSTDSTPRVLHEHAAHDSRIRVIELGASQGAAVARNAGIDAARGNYLSFLDSDNTWEPNFLQVSVANLHGRGLRFVYAAAQVATSGDRMFLAYQGGADALMIQNHIPMIAFVAEASLIRDVGSFDPKLRRWIDFDLIIRMARASEPTFLPFVGARYDNIEGSDDRITKVESPNWRFVAFGKNLVDWEAVGNAMGQRVDGRVSVLVQTFQDHKLTQDAVRAVLETTETDDVEVVIVDNGSEREVSALLTASFLGNPQVSILRFPRHYGHAAGANIAFQASTGSHVVFLGNDTVVRRGWLPPLIARLQDEQVLAAQPLLLSPADSVRSAGSIFLASNGIASPYLKDHPREDASRDNGIGFSAASGVALAMRATDVRMLNGFDCIFVNGMEDTDLCLRAAQERPGTFHVVHDSVVTHRMEAPIGRVSTQENRKLFLRRWRGQLPAPQGSRYGTIGLHLAHVGSSDAITPTPRPVLVRPSRQVREGPMSGTPSLRWAINIGAPGGPLGDGWGDTYYAAGLAEPLRELGQEVVVLRRGAHLSPSGYLNDVAVTIRGLTRAHPRPGVVNILWVISHPDLVSVNEVRDFDLVFAASSVWARDMSSRAGVPVETLHQATNPRTFHPAGATENRDGVLFVGNARRSSGRQIVSDALAAGVDLSVYGNLWEGRLPAGVLRGKFIDNHELVDSYASARVVLNDHWDDMARHGFPNNRLFDAVASGACVVSDYVEGIDDMFHGMVHTYRSVDELAHLCSDEGRSLFPDLDERRKIAEMVRHDHSFGKRAEVLLDSALKLHRAIPG